MNNKTIFNIIGFYLCWWMSIYGAAIEIYYIGPVCVLLFLLVHYLKIIYHENEILFLLICLFVGSTIGLTEDQLIEKIQSYPISHSMKLKLIDKIKSQK